MGMCPSQESLRGPLSVLLSLGASWDGRSPREADGAAAQPVPSDCKWPQQGAISVHHSLAATPQGECGKRGRCHVLILAWLRLLPMSQKLLGEQAQLHCGFSCSISKGNYHIGTDALWACQCLPCSWARPHLVRCAKSVMPALPLLYRQPSMGSGQAL